MWQYICTKKDAYMMDKKEDELPETRLNMEENYIT